MITRLFLTGAIIEILLTSYTSSGLTNVSPSQTPIARCCQKHKYRTIDDLNIDTTGYRANVTFGRLLPQNYADKTCKPTVGKCGKPLPSARDLSVLLFQNNPVEDPEWTLLFMQLGQFLSHDLSLAGAFGPPVQCCIDGQETEEARKSKRCYNIIVNSKNREGKEIACMNFVRTLTDKHCEQINSVTSSLDLSQVYGSREEVLKDIMGKGGRLRESKNQRLPLVKSDSCREGCPQGSCFTAGDVRVNQNPQLTLLHTIFLREHNRVAGILEKINPHWNNDKIFQETRKYLIAVYQKIVYYDWLPILLGHDYCVKSKLIYNEMGYINDCENIKPVIFNEYATGASRTLHSLIVGKIMKMDEHHSLSEFLRLKDNFNCASNLTQEKDLCQLTIGLVNQNEMKSDRNHVEDITQYLFGFDDLKAIDIQRGRDHGLVSYNDARQFCGLPKAEKFDDFADFIPKELIVLLKQQYKCVDDVDLVVGMQLEKIVDETFVGPTARCIIGKQFSHIRRSDPFWFESECAFTPEQLKEIRKANIASILCENVCDGDTPIQLNSFELPNDSKNKITACKNVARPNLSEWKEINSSQNIKKTNN